MGHTPIVVPKGSKFGMWTVDRELTANRAGQRRFLCRCTCGTETPVLLLNLRWGKSKSCQKCCKRGRKGPMSEGEKERRAFKRKLHVAELKEFGII